MKLCLSITDDVEKLAKDMNMPVEVVNNLVGMYYRTMGLETSVPTVDQLKSFQRELIKLDIARKVNEDLASKNVNYTNVAFESNYEQSIDKVLGTYVSDMLNKIGITTVSVSNEEITALAAKRISSAESEKSVYIEDLKDEGVLVDFDYSGVNGATSAYQTTKYTSQFEDENTGEISKKSITPKSIFHYAMLMLNDRLRATSGKIGLNTDQETRYDVYANNLDPDYPFDAISEAVEDILGIDLLSDNITINDKNIDIYNEIKSCLKTAFVAYENDLIRRGIVDKTHFANYFSSLYTKITNRDNNIIAMAYAEALEELRQEQHKNTKTVLSADEKAITSEFKVLGFERDGKIYYNRNIINANTMAHEYTHIWWDAISILEPELYKRGIELLRQTNIYQQLKSEGFYSGDNEHRLCSEVLSRLSGKKADEYLKQLDEENKGKSEAQRRNSLANKIREFIKEFWSNLRATFSNFSKKEAQKLDLSDIVSMPVRDLFSGVNPFTNMSVNANNAYFEQVETYRTKYSIRERQTIEKYFAGVITDPNNQFMDKLWVKCKMNISNNLNYLKGKKREFDKYLIEHKDDEDKTDYNKIKNKQKDIVRKLNSLNNSLNKLNKRDTRVIETINYMGLSDFINYTKQYILSNRNDENKDTVDKIFPSGKINDPISDIVVTEASKLLKITLGVNISFDTIDTRLDKSDIVDDDQDAAEDADDEQYGNSSDAFTYGGKIREEDPYKGTSKIRQYFSGIVNKDSEGKPRYINGVLDTISFEYAYAISLSEFAMSVVTPNDFATRESYDVNDRRYYDENGYYIGNYNLVMFERLSKKYPFFKSVIDRIKEGNDKSIIAEMYSNLRKDFIHYYGTGGKNGNIFLNETEARQSTVFAFMNNYQADVNFIKGMKVFNTDGKIELAFSTKGNEIAGVDGLFDVNSVPKLFKDDFIVKDGNIYHSGNFNAAHSISKPESNQSADEYIEANKDVIDYYIFVCNAIGLPYNKKEVLDKVKHGEMSTQNLKDAMDIVKHIISHLSSNDKKDNIMDRDTIASVGRLAETINIVMSFENRSSFPFGRKTRWSYAAPNFIDTMVKSLGSQKLGNQIDFALGYGTLGESAVIRNSRVYKYMKQEFEPYEWFYKNGSYRPLWLRGMMGKVTGVNNKTDSEEGFYLCDKIDGRDVLFHRRENKFGRVEDVEYKNWTANDIYMVHLMQYYDDCSGFLSSDTNNYSNKRLGNYVSPIFSSSPCCKTIKGFRIPFASYQLKLDNLIKQREDEISKYKDIDAHTLSLIESKYNDQIDQLKSQIDNQKFIIAKEIAVIIDQELDRIHLCKERDANGLSKIENFDKNGLKFCFFPSLNDKQIGGKDFIDVCTELADKGDTGSLQELLQNTALELLQDEYDDYKERLNDDFLFEFFCFLNNKDEWKHNSISLFNGKQNDSKAMYPDTVKETLKYDEYERIINKKKDDLTDEERAVVDNVNNTRESIRQLIEPFIEDFTYNNMLAQANIIEMTTTDIAYYKDDNGIDFQKRFKEVYASGLKLFTGSKYGKENETVMVLGDEYITSTSYANLRSVLHKLVREGKLSKIEMEGVMSNFMKICSTDAQAFRTLKSYRSILDMMGKWTGDMPETFKRIEEGKFTHKDFNTVFQTLKPFFYGLRSVDSSTEGHNVKLRVPTQHKNSEAVLLASFANAISMRLSENNKLKALEKFMDSHDIDVAMFSTAVKAGKIGELNIQYSKEKVANWIANNKNRYEKFKQENPDAKNDYAIIKAGLDKELDDALNDDYKHNVDNSIAHQEKYDNELKSLEIDDNVDALTKIISDSVLNEDGSFNTDVVYDVPYDNYMIAQQTPQDLFDEETIFGSQFRQLIIGALPNDFTLDYNGVKLEKRQVINLYRCLIAENIIESYVKTRGRMTNLRTIREILLQNITSNNGKYSNNLKYALDIVETIDPVTGEKKEVFNLPINDPSTCEEFQKVLLSVFKNKITKQTIKGGHAILMSNFGFTRELKTEVNYVKDKSNNIVKDKKGNPIKQIVVPVYLPVYDERLIEKYGKKVLDKGTGNENFEVDFEQIQKDCPELLEGIGYRIPTEGKYSMINFRIAGFLPRSMGSAIMLPADIVTLAGSDFDVDKMFLMMKDFTFKRYDVEKAHADYLINNTNDNEEQDDKEENDDSLSESQYFDDEKFKAWFSKNKHRYKYENKNMPLVVNGFDSHGDNTYEGLMKAISAKNDKGRYVNDKRSRDNAILDICIGILRNQDIASQFIHPGNFDTVISVADKTKLLEMFDNVWDEEAGQYVVNKNMEEFCKEVNKGITDDKLKLDPYNDNFYDVLYHRMYIDKRENVKISGKTINKLIRKAEKKRNPLSISTFAHFHQQNMAGNGLIGQYANNNTNINKTITHKLSVRPDLRFKFSYYDKQGNKKTKTVEYLDEEHDVNGTLQIHNTAELSAAAVDNEKNPQLAKIYQNEVSANFANYMLRTGMSIDSMALFLSRPSCIKFYKNDLKASDFDNILNGQKFDEYSIDDVESMKQISRKVDNDLATIYVLRKIWEASNQGLKTFTMNVKQDSPNGAIESQIHKAEAQVRKIEIMNATGKPALLGMNNHLKAGDLNWNVDEDELRNYIQKTDVFDSYDPMGQAFYTCGLELPYKMMERFFTNPRTVGFKNEIHNLWKNSIMPEDISWRYDRDLMYYLLTKTTLFGDERVDYAKQMPKVQITDQERKTFNTDEKFLLNEYKGLEINIPDEKGNAVYYRYAGMGNGNIGYVYEQQVQLMTYMQKRNYYLYQFPSYIQSLKKGKREDSIARRYNQLFDRIVIRDVYHKGFPTKEIALSFGNKPNEQQRDEVETTLEEMISSNDNDIFWLAKDLFMYSFYHDGLKTNLSKMFTPNFRSKFREYIYALNNMNEALNKESIKTMHKFNEFFVINNPEAAPVVIFNMDDAKGNKRNFIVKEEGSVYTIKNSKENGIPKTFDYPKYQRIKIYKDEFLCERINEQVFKNVIISADYRVMKVNPDPSYPMYNAKEIDTMNMFDEKKFNDQYGDVRSTASFEKSRSNFNSDLMYADQFEMMQNMAIPYFMVQEDEVNEPYSGSDTETIDSSDNEDNEYVSDEVKKMLTLNRNKQMFKLSDKDLGKTNNSLKNPLC